MTRQTITATATRFRTLADWLRWQETLNPRGIELGLERVREVANRLQLGNFQCPVVTVAGTNGKGSCVALMASMLSAQGYRVCAYTSPHLLRYNERVHIGGKEATDAQLCAAFERIEFARGDVPLTYFEFGTLAALQIFQALEPDAVLLEVGLGGRLDAVNLVDADLALVSSIGIDHTEWLGADREDIGYEKAGIFRSGCPAVCGDPQPPRRLLQHAEQIGASLKLMGRDFSYSVQARGDHWVWKGMNERIDDLPRPALGGDIQLRNAASAIAGLKLLAPVLEVSGESIRNGLLNVKLTGRFQCVPGAVPVILDVAHNTEACLALADNLAAQACKGRTLAVFGMLRDKPANEVARIMDAQVHAWYLGGLRAGDRTQEAMDLARKLGPLSGAISCHSDIAAAFKAARREARQGDRIVVFGSFHTVEAALRIAA